MAQVAATLCRYLLPPTFAPNPVLAKVTANKGRQGLYALQPALGATHNS